MKILSLVLAVLISCTSPKKNVVSQTSIISIKEIACGSLEVNKDDRIIGYIVKPFYIENVDRIKWVTEFEKSLESKYLNYYHKYFRTYWFTRNTNSDTVIQIQMLSPNQIKNIPNWQCEEQEVDVYNKLEKLKRNNNYPSSFTFNCTKGRFKALGDPD